MHVQIGVWEQKYLRLSINSKISQEVRLIAIYVILTTIVFILTNYCVLLELSEKLSLEVRQRASPMSDPKDGCLKVSSKASCLETGWFLALCITEVGTAKQFKSKNTLLLRREEVDWVEHALESNYRYTTSNRDYCC